MRPTVVFLFLVTLPAVYANAMSLLEPASIQQSAEQDAKQAFQQNDSRLIGIATRGLSVPGVDSDKIEVSKTRCGMRIIRRSDVIRSTTELQSRKKQAEYIEAYNRAMFKLCWLND